MQISSALRSFGRRTILRLARNVLHNTTVLSICLAISTWRTLNSEDRFRSTALSASDLLDRFALHRRRAFTWRTSFWRTQISPSFVTRDVHLTCVHADANLTCVHADAHLTCIHSDTWHTCKCLLHAQTLITFFFMYSCTVFFTTRVGGQRKWGYW